MCVRVSVSPTHTHTYTVRVEKNVTVFAATVCVCERFSYISVGVCVRIYASVCVCMCVLCVCVSLFNLKALGLLHSIRARTKQAYCFPLSLPLPVSFPPSLFLSHIPISHTLFYAFFSFIPSTGVEKLSHSCIIIILPAFSLSVSLSLSLSVWIFPTSQFGFSSVRFALAYRSAGSNLVTLCPVPRPQQKAQISICQKLQYGDICI